jgi:diguanylate cyclase (GGDEF)-like protein/PAS domain S-box-containing protein
MTQKAQKRTVSLGEVPPVNLSATWRGGLLCAGLILYAFAFHVLFLFAGVFEVNTTNSSIWYPPAGLRLAVLLIFGWRFGVLIFCSEAMHLLADGVLDAWGVKGAGVSDLPLIASLLAAIAIPPACYTLAAFFLERRQQRPDAGADPFTGILYFLFIVCLAAAATALLICLNLIIAGFLSWSAFRAAAGGHAVGDMIGILTLTPALLLAVTRAGHRWKIFPSTPAGMACIAGTALNWSETPATRTLVEGVAVCLLVSAALLAAGEHSGHFGHSSAVHWYPFLFPVIWLALRFGLAAAIIGTFCMNMAAAIAAAFYFPSNVETFEDVQMFMVTLSVTGLLMGSAVSELKNEKATLDLKVRNRTRDLLDEIDRRKRAEHDALREKQRAESYLAIAQPIIIAVDRGARITLVNNSAVRLLGERREDLLGRDWIDLVAAPAERPVLRLTHRALIEGEAPEASTFETRMRTQDGNLRVIDWRYALIRDDKGQILGILCSGDDITERMAAEEKLRYLASYDPATGLNNRNWLLDHFPRAIARCRRHNKLLAILFIDLSGFKQINDVYGHAQGDHILSATAARVKQSVRETDAVTRLGGDEFVVLLEDVAEPAIAVRIAETMLRIIAEPLRIDDDMVVVGASIGIAFYPYDGNTVEDLLSRADAAMYRAKHEQSHGYRVAPGVWRISRADEPDLSRKNG